MNTTQAHNMQDSYERDSLLWELRAANCQEDYDAARSALDIDDVGKTRYCMSDVKELASRAVGWLESNGLADKFDTIEFDDVKEDAGIAQEWRKSALVHRVMSPDEKGRALYAAHGYSLFKRGMNTLQGFCEFLPGYEHLSVPADEIAIMAGKHNWRKHKTHKTRLKLIKTPVLSTREKIELEIKITYGENSDEFKNTCKYTENQFKRVFFHKIRKVEKP